MTLVVRRALAVALLLLAGLLASSCGTKTKSILQVANIAPEVRVTAAPIDTNAVCAPDAARSCYSLTLNWVGYDPDGRVDHYVYAVDPQGPDTTWIVTTDNEKRLVFDAPALSNKPDFLTILRGYHVFVIAAVDNDNAVGPRVNRAFFSFTKAPTVTIDAPKPYPRNILTLPPSIRVSWHGRDEDGVFTTKPVRYKYLLINQANQEARYNEIVSTDGAAIRTFYAPEFKAEDGWTAIDGDTTTVQFTNLVPGATYMFMVVAFDEAGAFSPVFGFDTNIVQFTVGYAAAFGPRLTIFNESFFYQYPGASYNPAAEVFIEVPAGIRVSFNWFAQAPQGAILRAYRWMLDGDVFDQRARRDEITDVSRWSTPANNTLSATVGPFEEGDHFFYVDAEDNTGLKSLATVHFFVVKPTFAKSLLVVNDTRYKPDQYLATGAMVAPQGYWPSYAEMDTFMYARGGNPWKDYPDGTLTPPGILNGYDFDSLGTRRGIADQSTSLAKLGAYRHVIWMIDFASANFGNPGNVPSDPTTSLRYMSTAGHLNSLGAYVRMGGNVWLVGGGGAYATLIPYDDAANNGSGGNYIWNSTSAKRELAPGRFMYDVAKWQTVIRARSAISIGNGVQRSLGRFRSNPGIYANVPVSFDARTAATDPLPPLRNAPFFYPTTFASEFLNSDNAVVESVLGEPNDFKIEGFNDPIPGAVPRWPSSDTLNTVVTHVAAANAGSSRASGNVLHVQTQGGGASTGDFVMRDLGTSPPRDWSGLLTLKVAIKQNQPLQNVQWRVRAIDSDGNSASAPIDPPGLSSPDGRPITQTFIDYAIPQTAFVTDAGSSGQPNFVRIQKVAFVLERGDAAASTEFDNLDVVTLQEGAVLDSLLATRTTFATGPDVPINTTMTIYHGHDYPRPFIFTGFAPWNFRRSQCKALFDFVLQNVWGLYPTASSTFTASQPLSLAPAHRVSGGTLRVSPGVRSATPIRSVPTSTGGVRQSTNPGARSPRNGNP